MTKSYQNQEQDRRIKDLEDHWVILNSEFGSIKTNVDWLKEELVKLSDAFSSLNDKITWGFIVSIIVIVIAQMAIKFFNI